MTNNTLIPYNFKDMIIISGGQTGADQGALEGAQMAGFRTGGFIPKGFKTEKGPMPELGKKFRLIEASSTDYVYRTHRNVNSSTMTIWFGNEDSAGYIATFKACQSYNKQFYDVTNFTEDQLLKLLQHTKPTTLNVAGNRESKNIGIQEIVKNRVYNVLNKLK